MIKPIKFDFIDGPLTIQWIPPEVRVAKIRCHVDPNVMPGPTRYTALIELYPNKQYELTTLNKSSDAMHGPYFREHRSVIDYMHDCFSAIGLWRRADKDGAVKVVTNVRGIPPKTKNEEKQQMATRTFVVSWKLINDETGKQEAAGSLESNGRELTEVRHMQNLLKSGYQEPVEAIGDQLAAAQAAA